MQMRAYTIYDRKALQYHSPWFQHTDGMAVRALADLANDPTNNVGRHPGDYVLYMCGVYDDSTGIFTPQAPLLHVSDALALVHQLPSTPLFPEERPKSEAAPQPSEITQLPRRA